MPYVMVREENGLNLKKGDKLKHEEGKLPIALKFSAEWIEPETEPEPKKPAPKK